MDVLSASVQTVQMMPCKSADLRLFICLANTLLYKLERKRNVMFFTHFILLVLIVVLLRRKTRAFYSL